MIKYKGMYDVDVDAVTISNVYIISLVNTVGDTWQVEMEIRK